MQKRKYFLKLGLALALITTIIFSFNMNEASAAERIYYKNNTTAYNQGSSNSFYTSDGKVTIKVNILSISNNTKNNTLLVSLKKPFLGGYSLASSYRYSTTGTKTITYDFGKSGYYRIDLNLGGSTGFGTPVKFNTVTSIYE